MLIVVVILAILAAVALPQYSKTIEVNYRQQAQDLLTTIYYGERAYRLANNKFVIPAAWSDIFMDNPAVGGAPITFEVTAAAEDTFTAAATRAGGTLCNGQAITIDQDRALLGAWLTCP
ncbi:MAG: hypothetical protein A3C53_06330 [Omnitrophica WOR_2 bacterium RIFCSPHIGHO2_02_FULL_68_15]|nr:MAG: hypothetical protein A3C53_06330 [Omnitrophica WOR_2 bacterium RIFCSPHIGHO2_02_FULL_68_15]